VFPWDCRWGARGANDHKFDPILQADYYRLRSFLAPMLPRNDLPLATAEEYAKYLASEAEWQKKGLRRSCSRLRRFEKDVVEKTAAVAFMKVSGRDAGAAGASRRGSGRRRMSRSCNWRCRQMNDPNENPKAEADGGSRRRSMTR